MTSGRSAHWAAVSGPAGGALSSPAAEFRTANGRSAKDEAKARSRIGGDSAGSRDTGREGGWRVDPRRASALAHTRAIGRSRPAADQVHIPGGEPELPGS